MLILLDIDGVMVPANAWKKPEFLEDGFAAFSFKASQALKKILSETLADIILTTSHKSRFSSQEWYDIFNFRGIPVNGLKRLKENVGQLSRMDEILLWFNENDNGDSFVIIDDEKSLNNLPPFLKEKLVLTSGAIGLTNELADEAIAILKSETTPILR